MRSIPVAMAGYVLLVLVADRVVSSVRKATFGETDGNRGFVWYAWMQG